MIAAMLVGGPLSDKLGRRKVFVFGSSVMVAAGPGHSARHAHVRPAGSSITLVAGFGFGMFQAVDKALMSEVLPSKDSFAKDLGVVNIAATLPQTLAPAVARRDRARIRGYVGAVPRRQSCSRLLGAFAVWPIKAVK